MEALSDQQIVSLDLAKVEKLLGLSRILVAGIVAVLLAAFALGKAVQSNQSDLEKLRADFATLSARVTAIEVDRASKISDFEVLKRDMATTKNDVSWIRAALEKR